MNLIITTGKTNMIDIHNHILFNIDDGPKNLENMLMMLKQAKEQGVSGIVATPHHLHRKFNNNYHEIQILVDKIKENKEYKEIGIDLYIGQEIRVSDLIFKDIETKNILGINNSRYLLIELPTNEVPHYTRDLIYQLQIKGYIPIIAHPERNIIISKNIFALYELIEAGALSQVTSSSLNGDNGKKIQNRTIDLIERNLVHFIASDAHDTHKRPFLMKDLLNNKKLKKYKSKINELIANGNKVINDENILKKKPKMDKSIFDFIFK